MRQNTQTIMHQNTQTASTPSKAKKAQKNKRRAIHRRLREFPPEHFQNDFPRQLAYSPRPDLQQPFIAPFGGLEPSVQKLEERLDESTDLIVGDEIDSRLGRDCFSDAGITPYPHYAEEEHASRIPYFAAQHGARVGDTWNTNYRNTAQFEIRDGQAAGGSASYTNSMDFSPYPTDVGSGAFTSWSGPETTTPSSTSAPRGPVEYPVQVQNNDFGDPLNTASSWSVPHPASTTFTENWLGGGYTEYHGSGTWPDMNENFD
ncbi:hypothetical protein BJ912DRAFT_1050496 [Pholiota molesta]|nr:hypothetical protein BJ912DRAFT_1050496 [Pholiota molesta]